MFYPVSIINNFSSVEGAKDYVTAHYGHCYKLVSTVDNGDSVLCEFAAMYKTEDMHRKSLEAKISIYEVGLEKIYDNPEISHFSSLIESKIYEWKKELQLLGEK